MLDLFTIASSFRAAIEEAVRAGELREMATFPRGCCGFASELLQRYLFEQNIFTLYMSGQHGHGWYGESHAWLETQNGTVIDITGDQYKYNKLNFTEPVYVGLRTDGFHDKFELNKPEEYQFDDDPFVQNQEFNRIYGIIMRYMK